QLFPRFSGELVATALKDTPVVMVTGPRQCGKTIRVAHHEPGRVPAMSSIPSRIRRVYNPK
ncbi:MAG: hypothetical protein WAU92_07445, partial [Candidatus Sulfotelmatobacter sp.]